ncbi:MAG TPA: GIY-YIG nuclease family protein [Anaerolineales bacterium]|jgi:Uri superfamily endonuclease|nr:GIY-YIG nuclease family protein [Anaerolineales bacterium]
MIRRQEVLTDPASSRLCQALPRVPGSYALFLNLPGACHFRVGRSGEFFFPSGDYVYLGSAFGPGGLGARLGRHLRGDGTPRWHIDYLRKIAQVCGYAYLEANQDVDDVPNRGTMHGPAKLECRWSQALAALPGASIPAPGFGASDCEAGCPAHLVAFSHRIDPLKVRLALVQSAAVAYDQLISFFQN